MYLDAPNVTLLYQEYNHFFGEKTIDNLLFCSAHIPFIKLISACLVLELVYLIPLVISIQ